MMRMKPPKDLEMIRYIYRIKVRLIFVIIFFVYVRYIFPTGTTGWSGPINFKVFFNSSGIYIYIS